MIGASALLMRTLLGPPGAIGGRGGFVAGRDVRDVVAGAGLAHAFDPGLLELANVAAFRGAGAPTFAGGTLPDLLDRPFVFILFSFSLTAEVRDRVPISLAFPFSAAVGPRLAFGSGWKTCARPKIGCAIG